MPIFVPPMGSHGLAHVDKEAATFRKSGSYGERYVTSEGHRLRGDDVRRGLSDPTGKLAFGEKT